MSSLKSVLSIGAIPGANPIERDEKKQMRSTRKRSIMKQAFDVKMRGIKEQQRAEERLFQARYGKEDRASGATGVLGEEPILGSKRLSV